MRTADAIAAGGPSFAQGGPDAGGPGTKASNLPPPSARGPAISASGDNLRKIQLTNVRAGLLANAPCQSTHVSTD